jgi:hypothetical protein
LLRACVRQYQFHQPIEPQCRRNHYIANYGGTAFSSIPSLRLGLGHRPDGLHVFLFIGRAQTNVGREQANRKAILAFYSAGPDPAALWLRGQQ